MRCAWASARRLFLTAGLIFSLLAYAVLNKQWETFTPVLAFSGVFLGFLAYLMSGQRRLKRRKKMTRHELGRVWTGLHLPFDFFD